MCGPPSVPKVLTCSRSNVVGWLTLPMLSVPVKVVAPSATLPPGTSMPLIFVSAMFVVRASAPIAVHMPEEQFGMAPTVGVPVEYTIVPSANTPSEMEEPFEVQSQNVVAAAKVGPFSMPHTAVVHADPPPDDDVDALPSLPLLLLPPPLPPELPLMHAQAP